MLQCKYGAAFAPFADVLLVPLLDAACVRRLSAEDPAAISMASTYCVEALAVTTVLSVETLYRYYKAARATRNQRTKGGLKRHLVVKVLGITVKAWTKEELEPHYSLLKEFVREALHDNFLLVRVEARQVFSSLFDTWPELVKEFVYMPAPRIRAVLMADGYATTGIGVALHQKFRPKASPRPAAAKRDPPKVVNHCRRPAAAVTPDTSNVVDFHMLLIVQLLAVLFTTTVAVWQWSFGRMTKACDPMPNPSWNRSNDANALEGATPQHGRARSGGE
ncbi:hypothetical protein AC1031_005347 [Aphanomyces cochlioides]|nr:hypothetical protein AC1031_005347 [Aphanomyces cochlioides]